MKADDEKNIKIGVGILAVGLLGYFLIKKSDNGTGYGNDPTGNNIDNNNLVVFNAKVAAEKLYDAMKDTGTDEKAIMEVFQTVSVANYSKVFYAFGRRSYNANLGNQYTIPFASLPLQNLSYWLKSELSNSSFETLRIKYRATNLI